MSELRSFKDAASASAETALEDNDLVAIGIDGVRTWWTYLKDDTTTVGPDVLTAVSGRLHRSYTGNVRQYTTNEINSVTLSLGDNGIILPANPRRKRYVIAMPETTEATVYIREGATASSAFGGSHYKLIGGVGAFIAETDFTGDVYAFASAAVTIATHEAK